MVLNKYRGANVALSNNPDVETSATTRSWLQLKNLADSSALACENALCGITSMHIVDLKIALPLMVIEPAL